LHLEKNYNESEKSRIIRNYLVEDGFQLIDYQIHNPNRDSARIKLSYSATAQNIYLQYGNDILISNIEFPLPNFEKPQVRKLPVQIDYPIYKIDTIMYEIPTGYEININSDLYSFSNKYGDYGINIYENEGNVITIKSLLINAGYYPVSEYEDFYNFYYRIVESENKIHISLL
jgi:hypothetical protein